MRPDRILHPELAAALATLGHTDIILVTDAGFPIPPQAKRIDLGFCLAPLMYCIFCASYAKKFLWKKSALPVKSGIVTRNFIVTYKPSIPAPALNFRQPVTKRSATTLPTKPKLLSVPDHLIRGPISRWLPVPILLPGSPMNLA